MSRPLSSVRIVTVVGLTVLSLHCASGGSGAIGDGGLQTTNPDGAARCPNQPPTHGTACALASGTACNDYASPGCECCGATTYVCQNGKWLVQAGGGPPSGGAECPPQLPVDGTTCGSPCSGIAPPVCSYTCAQAGAESTANCRGGTWQVVKSKTACEIDAGSGSDASDAASDAPDGG